MAEHTFSSPALVKAIERVYGNKVRTIKIPLLHGRSINAYLKKIEEGHKKAAKSKLSFR